MKLNLINFGIASRQGDCIYMHKGLLAYPDLYKAILEHEKSHTKGYSWHDFSIDLRNSHLKGLKKQYYSFIIHNPSSLIEFLPLWVYQGSLVINPFILLFLGFFLGLMGIIGWLLS